MAILLSVIGLVGAPVTTALALWARKLSLRAPEGSAKRSPDVYDLAYLAGGPERATVTLVEALVRGQVAVTGEAGMVRLADDWVLGEREPPEHAGLAAAIKLLAGRGGAMPLPALADALRRDPVTTESVARLRRWHLLLPSGYRPPPLPRALIALAGACGAAGLAWSAWSAATGAGKVPGAVVGGAVVGGMVVGGVAVVLAVGGWWLAGRRPRVPVTDAGQQVLVMSYVHCRRGDLADVTGHRVALLGADAIAAPDLRERLGELEAARSVGWTWDPAVVPQHVITPGGIPASVAAGVGPGDSGYGGGHGGGHA
jgi:uncharacterized protein (TIGR04222 family)